MLKQISVFILLVLTVGFSSCETDFSLNGKYEIQPVVFGLLDHTKGVHMIKITKAFLGDDDNLIYAQNPDSNYFEKVDAKIIEYKDNVATGREWTLFDTIITTKSTDGIFYAPEQKVYAFYESTLDSTAEYELIVDINDGAYEVTGRTALIDQFKLTGTILNPAFKVQFAANTVNTDDDYVNWNVGFNEGLHASRYNYKYTFHWTETYADMSTASFSITRDNGDDTQDKPNSPLPHTAVFHGLDFYQWIGDLIVYDDNVIKREMDGLDLQIAVAHEELDQYMQVSEPATGIAQVQPEYTNLSKGRGLFSARIVFQMNGFKLNPSSMKELCVGQYTGGRQFCSNYPEHATEGFYCP